MAPFIPRTVTVGRNKIIKFGGLIVTEFLAPPPGRAFLLRQTHKRNDDVEVPAELRKVLDSKNKPIGPPNHFHPWQTEYFQVLQGWMYVESDGVGRVLRPEDGEITVTAGSIHRFQPHPDTPEDMVITVSASDSGGDWRLDRLFMENWYGFWHDSLIYDGKFNIIQMLSIWDAGGAYLVPPAWVPFRKSIGYWGSIIVGRWIGGLLGYKPFYKEYTTDWDYAVAKMKTSWFQRHLVEETYRVEKPWDVQVDMCAREGQGTNGELEHLLTDIIPASGRDCTERCSVGKGKIKEVAKPANGTDEPE